MLALRIIQELLRWDWPLNAASPLLGRFNPFLRKNRIDPYPHYRLLRSDSPIYWHPFLRMWIVTGYEEIKKLIVDDRLSVDRTKSPLIRPLLPKRSMTPGFLAAIQGSLLMTDPPGHTRLRALVGNALAPNAVNQMEDGVNEKAMDLLDSLCQKQENGKVDFMGGFAYPFPLAVVADFLGIPESDYSMLREWSAKLSVVLDLLQFPGGLRKADAAYRDFASYFLELFKQRRSKPEDDLVTRLVEARDGSDRLSDDELLSLCILILTAGHETVSKALGNGLYALSQAPEQKEELLNRPEIMGSAVDELLRFDSPVQMYDRVVLEDFSVDVEAGGSGSFKKGQLVTFVVGAGNRDPKRFENPDELNLTRSDNRHLSFSWGTHFCLGAALARLELETAFRAIFTRFPNLEVHPVAYQQRIRSHVLRGFSELDVSLK